MNPSEQIEALQLGCNAAATACHSSHAADCYCFIQNEAFVKALAPLLVAAKEQEAELADLHEQIMRYQADPQYDARFIEGQEKTEAMLREQHSADLREVAEMAIDVVTTGNKSFIRANSGSIADSIVREFREKQQKSKEGDARESGSSS